MFAEPPAAPVFAPVQPPPSTWRGRDSLFGLGALIGSLILVLGLGIAVTSALDLDQPGTDLAGAILTIGFELLFASVVLAMARRRGISLAALGFRRPDRWGPLGIAVVGTYATLLGYALALALLRELGVDPDWLEGGNTIPIRRGENAIPLPAILALFGFAVVIVAPLAEELFFRGLFFRALDGIWAGWAAIVVSGVAFGIFHLNPAVMVPFSVIGMIFAWAFKMSGSLWITIITHFIINSVSFTVTVLEVLD